MFMPNIPYNSQVFAAMSKVMRKNSLYRPCEIVHGVSQLLDLTVKEKANVYTAIYALKNKSILTKENGCYRLMLTKGEFRKLASGQLNNDIALLESQKKEELTAEVEEILGATATIESLNFKLEEQAIELQNLKVKINIIAAAICAGGRNIELAMM